MPETILQRKIRYRGCLPKHLTQMNYLCLDKIGENDLWSINKTDMLFKELKKISFEHQAIYYCKDFTVYEHIKLLKNGPILVLCEHSFDSGILQIDSLDKFNWKFNFQTLDFYRVSLLMKDFTNQITFWERDEDNFEIEIFGEIWSKISI